MSSSASDALAETLLTLDGEFAELEQEYGADLQQQSILEDPEIPITMSEEDSDPEETCLSVSECVEVETSDIDQQEEENLQNFLSDTCKCHLGTGNKPCCLTLSVNAIRQCRQSCFDLPHNELDLVIMSQVHYLRTTGGEDNSIRPVSNYYFHGVKICQATLLFIHARCKS